MSFCLSVRQISSIGAYKSLTRFSAAFSGVSYQALHFRHVPSKSRVPAKVYHESTPTTNMSQAHQDENAQLAEVYLTYLLAPTGFTFGLSAGEWHQTEFAPKQRSSIDIEVTYLAVAFERDALTNEVIRIVLYLPHMEKSTPSSLPFSSFGTTDVLDDTSKYGIAFLHNHPFGQDYFTSTTALKSRRYGKLAPSY